MKPVDHYNTVSRWSSDELQIDPHSPFSARVCEGKSARAHQAKLPWNNSCRLCEVKEDKTRIKRLVKVRTNLTCKLLLAFTTLIFAKEIQSIFYSSLSYFLFFFLIPLRFPIKKSSSGDIWYFSEFLTFNFYNSLIQLFIRLFNYIEDEAIRIRAFTKTGSYRAYTLAGRKEN